MLADIFENLWNICLEICEPDPVCFLTAPGLAWQAALKKTKVKLDLLTDINVLLMLGKGMRGGYFMLFINMLKLITNPWKIIILERSYLKCRDVNNLYGLAMSQKLPVNNFNWVKDISEFDEIFVKIYNEESD